MTEKNGYFSSPQDDGSFLGCLKKGMLFRRSVGEWNIVPAGLSAQRRAWGKVRGYIHAGHYGQQNAGRVGAGMGYAVHGGGVEFG